MLIVNCATNWWFSFPRTKQVQIYEVKTRRTLTAPSPRAVALSRAIRRVEPNHHPEPRKLTLKDLKGSWWQGLSLNP